MKSKFALIGLAIFILLALLCACNKQVIDITYNYDSAIISLPNGEVVSGKVDSWRDYDDGDQIQVQVDGTIYLVHSSNVVLMKSFN